jgi:hypothetical protein
MERTTSLVASKFFLLVLTFFWSVFLTACATLPNTSSLIREMPHKDPAPEIFGSQGELSPEKRKAIIHRLEKQAGSTDLLKRQIPLMESISDLPLAAGNKVTLLVDGPTTYAAMFRVMQGAETISTSRRSFLIMIKPADVLPISFFKSGLKGLRSISSMTAQDVSTPRQLSFNACGTAGSRRWHSIPSDRKTP